jgi:hypothetical protein
MKAENTARKIEILMLFFSSVYLLMQLLVDVLIKKIPFFEDLRLFIYTIQNKMFILSLILISGF